MRVNKQRDIFFNKEGDSWYLRNKKSLIHREYHEDSVVKSCKKILESRSKQVENLLEIGCGDGGRLEWLNEHLGIKCHGVDPSLMAVNMAHKLGLNVHRGTAEDLPFTDGMFDILVFGFCLYLCDREDLFKITFEANRVLKNQGWIIIHDFFTPMPIKRRYHHAKGIYSFKMDYRKLFEWHPHYDCLSHEITHHSKQEMTDDLQEWVATSILRKNIQHE